MATVTLIADPNPVPVGDVVSFDGSISDVWNFDSYEWNDPQVITQTASQILKSNDVTSTTAAPMPLYSKISFNIDADGTIVFFASNGGTYTQMGLVVRANTNKILLWQNGGFWEMSYSVISGDEYSIEFFVDFGSGGYTAKVYHGEAIIVDRFFAFRTDQPITDTTPISLKLDVEGSVYRNQTINTYGAPWELKRDSAAQYSGFSIDGVIEQDHTSPSTDDGTSWTLEANGDVSNVVVLGVTSGYFEYVGEYSVSLNLAMEIRGAWNGNNAIFDWGSTADTYNFDGDIITTNYDIWERLNSNDPSVIVSASGFYPFGTHFLGDVYGTRYPRYVGKSNFHGSFQSWGGEMIPDSSGGYTYDNTAWVAQNVTGFGLAGLANFPMPVCTPSSEYSIVYDRAGNVVREYDRGETTERRQFSMKWSNMCGDALRSILYQITSVIRSNTFKIDFGSNLNRLSPWLPREGELLTGEYDVRLSSPVIEYTYKGGGLWELTIEVIKWEQ